MKRYYRQAETNKIKDIVPFLSLNFEEKSCKPGEEVFFLKPTNSITVEVMAFVSDRLADKQAVQMYIYKPLYSPRKQERFVCSPFVRACFKRRQCNKNLTPTR